MSNHIGISNLNSLVCRDTFNCKQYNFFFILHYLNPDLNLCIEYYKSVASHGKLRRDRQYSETNIWSQEIKKDAAEIIGCQSFSGCCLSWIVKHQQFHIYQLGRNKDPKELTQIKCRTN